MINRIDKTDPLYRVNASKETKKDPHRESKQDKNQQKQQKKKSKGKYQSIPSNNADWNKFGSSSNVLRFITVPCARIKQCIYKTVYMHHGNAQAQIDILWIDDRITEGALLKLNSMDNYIALKKLKSNDPLPSFFWEDKDELELGIIQTMHSSGPFTLSQLHTIPAHTDFPKGNTSQLINQLMVQFKKFYVSEWGIIIIFISILFILGSIIILSL